MRRGLLAALCAAIAIALVGCGGGDGGSDAEPTATVTVQAPFDPSAALFTLSDMPVGWVKEKDDPDREVLCDTRLFDPSLVNAEVSFSQQGQLPQMNQHVGAYAPGAASAAMAATRKVFDACTTDKVDGLTWTLSPTSFPAMGDESLTYLATTDARGLRVTALFNAMRLGDGVVSVVYGGIGDVDTAAAEDYSRRALARLAAVQP